MTKRARRDLSSHLDKAGHAYWDKVWVGRPVPDAYNDDTRGRALRNLNQPGRSERGAVPVHRILATAPMVLFEGHDPSSVEIKLLRQLGFGKVQLIGYSERLRGLYLGLREA